MAQDASVLSFKIPQGGLLRCLSPVTACLLGGPMIAGLIATILPAFGYFPMLGGTRANLQSWRRLLETPGLLTSTWISLSTGLLTTLASLALVTAFCAGWHGTRLFDFMQRLLAPVLAVPHAAVALGIAFLLSPSGWILRAFSPWLTGFVQPPDWLIIHDAHGWALMAGLTAKEAPYLLIMVLAAIGQVKAGESYTVARTLGYRPVNAWLKAVFPRVYTQIRLPVITVLAYGVSVVDVALILGPTTPPPLSVLLLQKFNDPDITQRLPASAGALAQLGVAALGIILWVAMEGITRRIGTRCIVSGRRGGNDAVVRVPAAAAWVAGTALVLFGLMGMMLWSLARSWRFPHGLPSGLTFANWERHFSTFKEPLLNTLAVAASTAFIALTLAVGLLEAAAKSGRRSILHVSGLLYLPLVIPQIAFLFGIQMLLVTLGLDGRWMAVVWMHLVFVFPYVFLSLVDAYGHWDQRYQQTGLCLGARPARVFFKIKLPMLLRPILTAGAVGFAVSVGLYLPTLFAGSGHYPTVTTEAVTLSSGGDMRLVGLYALLQMILPFSAFLLALWLPAFRYRHRQGMRGLR